MGEIWKETHFKFVEFVKSYPKNICAVLKSPYFYLIVAASMILYGSFWAGILFGVVIVLLLPFLAKVFESLFALIRDAGRLLKGEFGPSDESDRDKPDNPQTP